MLNPSPRLLVFADDWGRHPSSCQHLVRHLLPRHEVIWVNTIGTRPPRLDRHTLRRGCEKLLHWTRRDVGTALPPGLRVVSPRMWPSFGSSFARRLNRRWLLNQLRPLLADGRPTVAVTTLPIAADLMGPLPVARWVYYCVDDFSAWPGLDGDVLRRLEQDVVRRADVLIAASEVLRDALTAAGRMAHLLPHGVDLDHWQSPAVQPVAPDTLANLERPIVLFWGLVDRRLDVDWLRELSRTLDRGTIALVGPQEHPDPALAGLPRVRLLPGVPYEQLPALARQAAVLVMPYADLPVTRAMQPLKLLEYLATGCPIVTAALPACRAWADCLDLTASPAEFAARVRERIRGGLPPSQQAARGRLLAESWSAKAAQFEDLLLAGLETNGSNGEAPAGSDAAEGQGEGLRAAAATPGGRQ